jgi:WD40 repeat protein
VWDPTTRVKQRTLKGHSHWVTAVQFSRDGSKLASASDDGTVIVWDPTTGVKQHTLEGHFGGVSAVQFSPDGSKLASASDDETIIVWDPTTGVKQRTLEGHSDWVTTMQFSRDGSKLASASHDKTVIVWDPTTGVKQRTLKGHSRGVTAVQFSRDGSKLASASDDGTVIVWDLTTNTLMEEIDVKGFVSDLAFSADGLYLKTNFGSFKLKVGVGGSQSEDACALHLRYQKEWILRHEHKMIWLPPELRPGGHATAIRGEIMAFGHSSGTVTFWEISG